MTMAFKHRGVVHGSMGALNSAPGLTVATGATPQRMKYRGPMLLSLGGVISSSWLSGFETNVSGLVTSFVMARVVLAGFMGQGGSPLPSWLTTHHLSLLFNNSLSFHQHRGEIGSTRLFSSTSWRGEKQTFFLHLFSMTYRMPASFFNPLFPLDPGRCGIR